MNPETESLKMIEPTAFDKEPDGDDLRPFCAGCGDRIEMSRCLDYGVCHACINTTDDPWFRPRAGEG